MSSPQQAAPQHGPPPTCAPAPDTSACLPPCKQGKRPLIPPSMPFSPDAKEVIDTLK